MGNWANKNYNSCFGVNLGIHRWVTGLTKMIVCPDPGAGYDPEALFVQIVKLLQTWLITMGTDYEFWPSAVMAGSSSHYQPDFEKIRK